MKSKTFRAIIIEKNIVSYSAAIYGGRSTPARNMAGSITGMICGGGNQGCAMKSVVAVDAGFRSADLAMSGVSIDEIHGINSPTPEETMRNMGRIASPGMVGTEKTILKIFHIMQATPTAPGGAVGVHLKKAIISAKASEQVPPSHNESCSSYDETETQAQKPYGSSWFSSAAHSDPEILRKEYRQLAKQYHPDTSNLKNSTRIFQEILNEKVEILENMK